MNNFQMYRGIMNPGWTLGWSWAKKEVIWTMVGAQTTEQGDCSKFKGGVPHCCKRTPTVVDLLPGVPYNQQFTNCCKGGVLGTWGQDPLSAVSAFQVSVGLAGTSNKTVKLPKNFTLLGPGPGYTCGPAKIVPSTVFLTADKRRKTQALSEFLLSFSLLSILLNRYLCRFCIIFIILLNGFCMQWHGMWHALILSFLPLRILAVVFPFHPSTIKQSPPAHLVLVVARTRKIVSSKLLITSSACNDAHICILVNILY